MQPEDGLEQVGETFERDVLTGAQIRGHGHDVGSVGHRRVHVFREPSLAAVPAVHLTRIQGWFITVAMIGNGMSTTCLMAATVTDSMSSVPLHSGQTAAGYQRSASVISPDCSRVPP